MSGDAMPALRCTVLCHSTHCLAHPLPPSRPIAFFVTLWFSDLVPYVSNFKNVSRQNRCGVPLVYAKYAFIVYYESMLPHIWHINTTYNFKLFYFIRFSYCMVLPKETSKRYKIIYCGFKDPNPSKLHVETVLRMYQKTMLTRIMNQGSGEGCVFVYDTKGLSLGHFATLTISLIRKYLYFAQVSIIYAILIKVFTNYKNNGLKLYEENHEEIFQKKNTENINLREFKIPE